jgi:predicted O-methyltransferase YrrM
MATQWPIVSRGRFVTFLGISLAVAILVSLGRSAAIQVRSRFIEPIVRNILYADAHNIELARQRQALLEAVQFVDEHMSVTPSFKDKFELFKHSLSSVDRKSDGLYCEFGVFTGTTINFIADEVPDRQIHGFDSFEGLPEDWRDGFSKGFFKLDKLPKVRRNVILHKGWFDQTVPVFKAQYPKMMAFMHMDADLYSSTKTVFDVLGDRIAPGTVIQFDELFNYPGWQQGEYKALNELVRERKLTFEYIGYCLYHEQVAVKITGFSH